MANDHMSNNSASMDPEFHDKYTVKMIRNVPFEATPPAIASLFNPDSFTASIACSTSTSQTAL